jgi:hypothetical protein
MNRKTVELKAPKPRNPLVAAALFRNAGTHRKTNKALRRQEKSKTGSVAQVAEQAAFNREVAISIIAGPTRKSSQKQPFVFESFFRP